VAKRGRGRAVPAGAQRLSPVIGGFLPKLEELVERSRGKFRADVVHDKITAMGSAGSERTTRRAVARLKCRQLKAAYRAGQRRVFRPWIPEPGTCAQYDFGDGSLIGEAKTALLCFWLAWSRFRWCCRCWIGPSRRCSRRSMWRCAGPAVCRPTC
jgi:hypothetical protein